MRFVLTTCLLCLLLTAPTRAHKPSDSYLQITGGQDKLTARWDIALKDLQYLLSLDANHNGEITWGELKAQRKAIVAHALSRLSLATEGQDRHLKVVDMQVAQHSDGCYAALLLEIDCPGDVAQFEVDYHLLFDVDPTHRGLVLYRNGSVTSTHVLSPSVSQLVLRTSEISLGQAFLDYLREGVWHIWIGLDHVLFLLSLLLPAVLVRREHAWQPSDDFSLVAKNVLKIVTVFTLAHSITLWLAVMEYVTLPSMLVEATIAFSIVVTACHNLYPVLPLSNWAIAFGFGLVHGFGFANVLVDLGLSSTALAVSLLGFNGGVELGQLAIVLVFLPLALLLRNTFFYRRLVLQAGSVGVAIVASIWIYERLFNAEIIGI